MTRNGQKNDWKQKDPYPTFQLINVLGYVNSLVGRKHITHIY